MGAFFRPRFRTAAAAAAYVQARTTCPGRPGLPVSRRGHESTGVLGVAAGRRGRHHRGAADALERGALLSSRTPTRRAAWSRAGAGSWRIRTALMPRFSASPRARRRASIRSTAGCWRRPGKRLKTRGCRRKSSPAPAPAFSSAFRTAIIQICTAATPARSTATRTSAARFPSRPTGFRISSICAARASRWTRPARRRSWRCTSRRRACGRANRTTPLVGGANAVLSPEGGIGFSQAHMLSPRGRCRAFDAGADGYVRAEGAAALVAHAVAHRAGARLARARAARWRQRQTRTATRSAVSRCRAAKRRKP